jgi:hypothetical protein
VRLPPRYYQSAEYALGGDGVDQHASSGWPCCRAHRPCRGTMHSRCGCGCAGSRTRTAERPVRTRYIVGSNPQKPC